MYNPFIISAFETKKKQNNKSYLKQLASTGWERRSQLHAAIKPIKMLSVTLALSATPDESTRYYSDILKVFFFTILWHP